MSIGEGRAGYDQRLDSSVVDGCVAVGLEATDFYAKRMSIEVRVVASGKAWGWLSSCMTSGIAGLDMVAATLKMNDVGSFNLLVGATDLGTGSDTILA
jgi:putative selenate reductase molybdopterin-binding subunit